MQVRIGPYILLIAIVSDTSDVGLLMTLTHIKAQLYRFGEWRRLCLLTLKLIRRVIYLAREQLLMLIISRDKK